MVSGGGGLWIRGRLVRTGGMRVIFMMAAMAPVVKIALITSWGAHNGPFPILAHVL